MKQTSEYKTNKPKKKTHRYRKQTSSCQWREGSGERQDRGWGQEVQTAIYKIDKPQWCIVQQRKYSQNNYKWSRIFKNVTH